MIDSNYQNNQVNGGVNTSLFEAQKNQLKLHKGHVISSTTSSHICTSLSQELAKMQIVDFDYPTKDLDTFDSFLAKLNTISKIVP